jgi:ABC-type uncharacterized transport system permease subunit
MAIQLTTAWVGAIGFLVAGIAGYFSLRHRVRVAVAVLRVTAIAAVALNLIYLVTAVARLGPVVTFRHGFESTLLLAALIGIVGLVTHATSALRGLDGVLFLFAALVQFGSLAVMKDSVEDLNVGPWFASHGLAFAVSGACFVAGGAAGIAYLIMHRTLRAKRATTLLGRVASLEALERFGRWMVMTGFPIFTYGILTGLCGIAHERASDRAGWLVEPMVILSFVTWLVYAIMVTAILFRPQIRGRHAAALAATGTSLIVVVFLVVELISPLHP